MENHDINPTEQYDPLGRDKPAQAGSYTPVCAWPEDCLVQWGDRGLVLRREKSGGSYTTAFFEAFPNNPQTFIRGEGVCIEEAERLAFKQFEGLQEVLPMDDAAKHRMDFLRIRDTDGRIFTVCLDCGKREYEAAR